MVTFTLSVEPLRVLRKHSWRDFLYPVQVKLFLFLFLIIKYVIWRDKILLWWCLIQNTRVSKGKKVSFKATPSGQCPPHSRLASTESCGCDVFTHECLGEDVKPTCSKPHWAHGERLTVRYSVPEKRNTLWLGQCNLNTNSEPCVVSL